ncbi:hypothetical protein CL689_01330 [Candidatus Saccharibacteria bacterium]|nr:hypothetical protein [Candidatus Saccharibacteria bacterium]MBQ68692.1 hypothetical protein [Candidatus Saccharibacteria bacterium]
MTVVLIFAAIAVVLFLAAFFSKRRFGLLGLALTAGATLSTIWSYDAGLLLSSLGVFPNGPLTNAVALSAVVLLPALLLLFHGYSYKSLIGRLVGALLFTLLALAFLVEPLEFALPLTGTAGQVYATINGYKDIIISAGVIIAVVDLFFTKPAKHDKDKHR